MTNYNKHLREVKRLLNQHAKVAYHVEDDAKHLKITLRHKTGASKMFFASKTTRDPRTYKNFRRDLKRAHGALLAEVRKQDEHD